ncbi:MAG TPA: hydroxysqualene dehydroxylase HpnE [Gaiellales bacterium]|jgi:squalene-associated FAD-dependent desaturase|nr:hydroxysqualene dehydroxylase HpnE [Gaiellales bacterium]
MSRPDVLVVGGGLAGIATALECADRGLDTALVERRPWLGGATYSMQRGGLWIDNGQHVFLRCCTHYRGLLERLSATAMTRLQTRLEIPLVEPGGAVRTLRRAALPSPLHLAPVLLRLPGLSAADRLRAAAAVLALGRIDPADPAHDARSMGDWLARHDQSPVAVNRMWDLIVRPTLNLRSQDASLAMAAKVFRTGLLEDSAAGDIGWATAPLRDLHHVAGLAALDEAGVAVETCVRVRSLSADGPGFSATADDRRLSARSVVVCLPPEAALSVLPPGTVDAAVGRLSRSPIVNLHVVYDRPVTRLPLAAATVGPVQWVFDRTRSAGLAGGQYLAVSLSAADRFVGWPATEIRRTFVPALAELFPEAASASLEQFMVTRDRAATLRPAPGTGALRPPTATAVPGLYLAGAWTSTGWPDTMEGAVRSGRAAARSLLADLSRRPRRVLEPAL